MTRKPIPGVTPTPRANLRPLISSLIERDGSYCHYCGILLLASATDFASVVRGRRFIYTTPAWPMVDHKVPCRRGGANTIDNLVLCCNLCNQYKSDKPYDQFVAEINDWMDRYDIRPIIRAVRQAFDSTHGGTR